MFVCQAEDGIRGAQESRGLGDVYKRQHQERAVGHHDRVADLVHAGAVKPVEVFTHCCFCSRVEGQDAHQRGSLGTVVLAAIWIVDGALDTVSYTHLTLPTIYDV